MNKHDTHSDEQYLSTSQDFRGKYNFFFNFFFLLSYVYPYFQVSMHAESSVSDLLPNSMELDQH